MIKLPTVPKPKADRALDRIVVHKEALEKHLAGRWKDLFGASFDVLLYDLTSTYFEGEVQEVDKARFGYSRDQRSDCKQIILALVVTPEGFPLFYEIFDGNRADVSTLEEMLDAVGANMARPGGCGFSTAASSDNSPDGRYSHFGNGAAPLVLSGTPFAGALELDQTG